MRAIVLTKFGAPSVLEAKDVAVPEPGPGEVRVRVIASGTNPVDAKIRAAGSWAQITPPCVIGYDASGAIDAAGPGVTEWKKGDEVFFTPEIFGNAHGTYAEFTVVPSRIIAKKPAGLSHEEAAAVPLAGGTAYEAVVRRLALRVGETLLVHGGAGGVGSFAVQIAKAAGARVLATASKDNLSFLKELGADVAIDYRAGDVAQAVLDATGGAGVDACFDTAGGNVIPSISAVRPFGRLATILGVNGDLTPAYPRNQTVHLVFLTRERARLDELRPLLERKQVRPILDRVLPLDRVREAHERLDTGHGRGKIILKLQ